LKNAFKASKRLNAAKKIFTAAKNAIDKIHRFPKTVLKIGYAMLIFYYALSIILKLYAPYTENYIQTLFVSKSAIEAGNASVVAAIASAMICDLVLKSQKSGGKN